MILILLTVLVVLLTAAKISWDSWHSKRLFCVPLPRFYRDRPSQQAAWRKACGEDVREKADALLKTLCEAFSFNPDDRYQFAPTDRIMDVYRACYSRWRFWKIADAMEIESLMMDLSRRFQLDDAEWSDLTLGEIAALIRVCE